MKALILAGGKGETLLPVTTNNPKLLVPIGNIPFIFYQLNILKKAGIKEVIISLTYQPRKIKELLGDGANYGLVIRYTNEPDPLGTAGAVKNAEHMIDKTLVVLNGDILTSINLRKVIERHFQKKAMATLVSASTSDPEQYGVIRQNRRHMVTRFTEKPSDAENQKGQVNVGIYVFEKSVLNYIPERSYYTIENDLFPGLIANDASIYSYNTREYWLHLQDPGRYLQANFDVLSGRVPLPKFFGLFERTPLNLHPSCRVDDRSFVDESCLIKKGAVIENSVVGGKCRIEQNVRIKDSVLMPGTRLKEKALLRHCVAGKNCVIGRSVHIVQGAILGDKSIIPDFSRF